MKDEALKLALEALETELVVDMTNGAEVGEAAELMCEAITAIKQALAAPVQDEFDIRGMLASKLTCWNRLRETEANELVALVASLSQPAPVQEPIGYLFQHEETGLTTVVDVQQVEWCFEKNNPRHQKIGPVYTTPPAAQQPWVGLTDEEIDEVTDAQWANNGNKPIYAAHRAYARAIEAKLKELNT